MDKIQANTTIKHLGGNKFIAMTGAKNFVFGPLGIGFKIGRNCHSINYIRISINGLDLYNIEFIRIRKSNLKVINKITNIYNDQLQSVFTKYTGLYTYL